MCSSRCRWFRDLGDPTLLVAQNWERSRRDFTRCSLGGWWLAYGSF
jgi:hypothetical protein